MSFEYLTNIPLEQAKKDYLALLRENGFCPQTETVAVQHAYGRVTSRAVYANINAPHYAASAMDGIALHARDSFDATETTPVILREDQYVVVDTGDPVPEGCDAVIMVGRDDSPRLYRGHSRGHRRHDRRRRDGA